MRTKTKKNILLISMLCSVNLAIAQKSKVTDFTLLNTVNNQQVSLSDFSGAKGVVVIFTSNYCPYSKLYEERVVEMANNYSSRGISFILINPNNPISAKDDSVEEMAKKARESGYGFPYLADKGQQVQDMFGASKTPEAFLLKPANGGFNVIYSGAIDDNPQVADDVSDNYLKNAIDALLNNKNPIVKNMRPTGCMIKKS